MEEWRALPLWSPHIHHVSESKVQCMTQAQKRLRAAGLLTTGDISDANGQFKLWETLPVDNNDNVGRRAYTALLANIGNPAPFEHQIGPHLLYYGEDSSESLGQLWQYDVQQHVVSSQWQIIRDSSLPISTFECKAGSIRKITRSCPPNVVVLHRVLVCHSNRQGAKRTHFGFWSAQQHFLLQYQWLDGTSLLDTSTSQRRALQANQRFKPHTATAKWERELGVVVPVDIWKGTWLPFRGANENTFLWKLYYRVIATQRWRFPSIPVDDPQLRCTRCNLEAKEDIIHCVWSCPLSQPCWQWGLGLLQASSDQRHRLGGFRGSLEPAHIFVASPLPACWKIPGRFWLILRAVICWQVWKSRNEHFMANRPSDPARTIQKSWHRFSNYVHS